MLSTYIWAINMVKKKYILYQNIIINIILVL